MYDRISYKIDYASAMKKCADVFHTKKELIDYINKSTHFSVRDDKIYHNDCQYDCGEVGGLILKLPSLAFIDEGVIFCGKVCQGFRFIVDKKFRFHYMTHDTVDVLLAEVDRLTLDCLKEVKKRQREIKQQQIMAEAEMNMEV